MDKKFCFPEFQTLYQIVLKNHRTITRTIKFCSDQTNKGICFEDLSYVELWDLENSCFYS